MKLPIQRASLAEQLCERLFSGLSNEALNFLTSSAGLVRLIDRASRDDCGVDEATRLVQSEPLVAAKLVAVANSAAYNRTGRSITTVKDALNLVGLGVLKAIASAVAMRQLADRATQPNQATVSRLWAHSVEVAALAAVISRRFTRVPAETALFAGIVHEIAGFYMLAHASELVDLTGDVVGTVRQDTAAQEERVNSVMAIGTRRLLAALQVPDEIGEAIEGQWQGFVMVPPETLSDTLLIAKLLAITPSPFEPQGKDSMAAGLDLDGVLERNSVAAVLRDRYEEVRSLQQVFSQR